METTTVERIEGPVHGCYIASYAVSVPGNSGYVAYVKVCHARPVNYWQASCSAKFATRREYPTPYVALEHAHRLARYVIWETARSLMQGGPRAQLKLQPFIVLPNSYPTAV